MCFDFAKHGRPKVPIRKLSPSGSIKTEVHAPGFYEFASKFYLIRARSARKRHAVGVPFLRPSGTPRPKGALSPPNLAFGKAGGQAHRSAPHKIPHKSPALPDFYTSARAVAARPRPPCGREGGIPSGFSGTGGVSRGDSVPPGSRTLSAAYPGYTQGGYEGVSSPSSCAAIPRSA